jgi:hypothetical protein
VEDDRREAWCWGWKWKRESVRSSGKPGLTVGRWNEVPLVAGFGPVQSSTVEMRMQRFMTHPGGREPGISHFGCEPLSCC